MSNEIRLSMDELFELKKWAKYGQMMAGFIHNLNTPLMGVSGRIELMEIKYPDLKGFEQMTKHVDTLNEMLQCVAYFTDKDTNAKEYSVNISEFVHKLDLFMKSNIMYKHHVYIEKQLESVELKTNIQYLFNALFQIINYLLSVSKEEDNIIYTNTSNELKISLSRNEDNEDIELEELNITEALTYAQDLLTKNKFELIINNNNRELSIIIKF